MKKALFIILISLISMVGYSQNILTREIFTNGNYEKSLTKVKVGPDSAMYLMNESESIIKKIDKNGNEDTTVYLSYLSGNTIPAGLIKNSVTFTDTSVIVFARIGGSYLTPVNHRYAILEYTKDLVLVDTLKVFSTSELSVPDDGLFYKTFIKRISTGKYLICRGLGSTRFQVLGNGFNIDTFLAFPNSRVSPIKMIERGNYIYSVSSSFTYVTRINKTDLSFNQTNLFNNGTAKDLIYTDSSFYVIVVKLGSSSGLNDTTIMLKFDNNLQMVYKKYLNNSSISYRFIETNKDSTISVSKGSVIYNLRKSDGSVIDSVLYLSSQLSIKAVDFVNGRNVTINLVYNLGSSKARNILSVIDTNLNYQICNFSTKPICLVSVDNTNGKNRINWDPIGASEYYIYREKTLSGNYELIGTVRNDTDGYFIDTTSNPLQRSNRYILSSKYACGVVTPGSTPHETIHLSATPNTTGGVNLSWNKYVGFEFQSYYIYRGSRIDSMLLIDSIQSTLTAYTDLNPVVGSIYYEVRARKSGDCEYNPYYGKNGSYVETSSNRVNKVLTGINLAKSKLVAKLYPNPTNGSANLEVLTDKLFNVTISDLTGRIIWESSNNLNSITLDKSMVGFKSGLYLVKIFNSESFKVEKLQFID